MLKPNDYLGPYTLIRQLGNGAFGVVWLAEKRTAIATSTVAIKIPVQEEPDIEAIKQEAALWASIGGHPNVLPMIEANIYDNYIVIVSEYAPDGSLENWLRKNGGRAASIEIAATMVIGILAGLEHLHSRRVLHRDLKPDNILMQGQTPRLADFGLSRVLKSTSQHTKASGTPLYMSPEAFDGKKVAQTDIWAAGVIFYQLLTGTFPFPARDYAGLIGAIMLKSPEPLPSSVPEQFRQIIYKSLQKDVAQRYSSATEMKNDLQKLLNQLAAGIFNKQLNISMEQTVKQEIRPLPSSNNNSSSQATISYQSGANSAGGVMPMPTPIPTPIPTPLPTPTPQPANRNFTNPQSLNAGVNSGINSGINAGTNSAVNSGAFSNANLRYSQSLEAANNEKNLLWIIGIGFGIVVLLIALLVVGFIIYAITK